MAETEAQIVVIGNLDQSWVEEIARRPNLMIRLDAMSAVAALQKARVLLIGDGIPAGDLDNLMLTAREAAPTVRLFAVSRDLSLRADAADADAAFEMPRDADRLGQAASHLLRHGRARRLWYRETAAGLVGFGLILAVWAAAAALDLLPPFLLPAPMNVARAFLADSGQFLSDLGITAMEAAIGFVLGNAAGILFAVILYPSRRVQAASLPALTGLQALPIIALAPLLALWLGTGLVSKVAMAAIVCFFPIIANLLAAFSAVDRDLVELFRFHRASYLTTLRRLLFPGSAPALVAGLRTSASLAVVGALVAEFTGADRGLGYQILTTSYRLQTDRLFVAILLSSLLGIAFAAAPPFFGSFWLRRTRSVSSENDV